MIKLHLVEAALLSSVVSFFLFFGFATSVNVVSSNYEERIEEVRKEEGNNRLKLLSTRQRLQRQTRRADSLDLIVEAMKRPEIVWTARAIFSETKRPYEMKRVAWVVRNRYEVEHRGAQTYRDVVLDHRQFSGFNRGYPKRDLYLSLEPKHSGLVRGWHTALHIARDVVDAPEENRPFLKSTLFFYSEHALNSRPHWEASMIEVRTPDIQSHRFRFLRKTNFTENDRTSHRSR